MAVTLDIDGSIQGIVAKARQTKTELEGIADGYEAIGAASQKAIGGAVSGQDQLGAATKSTGTEINKQSGIVQKLEAHLKRLEQGQKKTNDPKLIKKYNTEIAQTRATLAGIGGAGTAGAAGVSAVNVAGSAGVGIFTALKGVLATTFAPILAAGAAIGVLKNIVGLVNEYEQTAADLSAITGANGETLEFLKQSAVEVGVETTVSAAQTLEAYKLIASAKPELLSNAEGLAEITREAVTLTEAMGGDLPSAATNLIDVMNQFNAPASEASRFVNALAAGSKEGSADVQQLADSILVAGTEAQASNVAFEETVGLTEALAEKGKKGAEAGTALRNIFSKLSATDILPKEATDRLNAAGVDIDQLSDKSLTFTQRLEALKPVQNDANALTAVFGLENKSTAQILLGNIDRVNELTAAVTGTSTAQEQAAVRTATASGEWAKLKNTIQALVQENGDGLSGFLAFIISFVRNGILFMRDRIEDLRPSFNLISEAVGGFVGAIQQLIPQQEKAAGGASLWAKFVKVLNVPLKLLFGFIAGGINLATQLTTAFVQFVNKNQGLKTFFNTLKDSISAFFTAFIDLPSYVSGALASIGTFVTETKNSIATLADNVGSVLSEAFNIKKLITEGTGDLEKSVQDLLVNPFKGVGTKAREAFTTAFNESKKALSVPVAVTPQGVAAPETTSTTPDEPVSTPEAAFSRSDNEAAKKAAQDAKEAAKLQADIAKAKIAALKDGLEKELALEELRFSDLKAKLDQYGIDSTEATYQSELNKFAIKQKFTDELSSLEGLSGEERITAIYNQTKAEIDAIETAIATAGGGSVTDEQAKQIALLRKNASDSYLQELKEFQDKETAAKEQHEINLLELERGNFKTQEEFETFKQEEIFKIRLKYAEAQLALIESVQGKESDAALSLRGTINEIKGEIAAIGELGGAAQEFSLFKLFGLDPNDPTNAGVIEGIQVAAQTAVDVLTQINDVRLETAQQAIDASDEEIEAIQEKIDAKETELDDELALAEEGYANNAEGVQQEIDLLKQQQEQERVERNKALAEKKKIQKQQAIVDTITQGTSLITAAAQVFNSVAAIPFVGPAIGAALVAAMIGSFIAAKSKVFSNISSQKAERGLFQVVDGERHLNGGTNLGHIEAEKGEALGILSRSATKKHGKRFEAFVNAANKGGDPTFNLADELLAARVEINPEAAKVIELNSINNEALKNEVTANFENEALRENNNLLKSMLKAKDADRKKKKTEYGNGVKIERRGNSTRIIKKVG